MEEHILDDAISALQQCWGWIWGPGKVSLADDSRSIGLLCDVNSLQAFAVFLLEQESCGPRVRVRSVELVALSLTEPCCSSIPTTFEEEVYMSLLMPCNDLHTVSLEMKTGFSPSHNLEEASLHRQFWT